MTDSPYLTLAEAAERMRCSTKTFRRKVLPMLTPIRVGSILLFTEQELDEWADRARDGASENLESQGTRTPSASRARRRGGASSSPRARTILEKLRG